MQPAMAWTNLHKWAVLSEPLLHSITLIDWFLGQSVYYETHKIALYTCSSGDFSSLLISFANSLDSDQDRLTHYKCSWVNSLKNEILKKVSRWREKHEKLPSMQRVKMSAAGTFEPQHVISNNVTFWQVQPPIKLRNSKWCLISSLTLIGYTSNQQRLWSHCKYAQADLRLCCSHIPHCWKSHVAAHLFCLFIGPSTIFGHKGKLSKS